MVDKYLGILNGLIADPDRGLLIVVLALVALIIILATKINPKYQKYRLMLCFACLVVIVAGFILRYINGDDGPVREVQYFGYFGDVRPDGSSYLNSENVHLKISNNNISGHSEAEEPDEHNVMRHKEWYYRGLTSQTGYAISYKTIPTKDEGNPVGVGAIFVKSVGERSMAGMAVEFDCYHEEWDVCPYALSLDDMKHDEQEIRKNWPILNKACVKIDWMSTVSMAMKDDKNIKLAESTPESCLSNKKTER